MLDLEPVSFGGYEVSIGKTHITAPLGTLFCWEQALTGRLQVRLTKPGLPFIEGKGETASPELSISRPTWQRDLKPNPAIWLLLAIMVIFWPHLLSYLAAAFVILGFPCGSAGKESTCNMGDLGLIPGLGRFPWRRERLPTPVFWPREFHGLYSLWGHKESDTTERLSLSLHSSYLLNFRIQVRKTSTFIDTLS